MAGGPKGSPGCFIPGLHARQPSCWQIRPASLSSACALRAQGQAIPDDNCTCMLDDENDDLLNDDFDEDEACEGSGDYGPLRCPANQSIHELVESVVDVVRWQDDYAECICPYGHRDAHLYVSGAIPHLHCLHERCRAEVAEVNAQLREFARANRSPEQWSALFNPDKVEQARRRRLRLIRAQARNRLLPHLLKKGQPVTRENWLARSPLRLDACSRLERAQKLRLRQFDPAHLTRAIAVKHSVGVARFIRKHDQHFAAQHDVRAHHVAAWHLNKRSAFDTLAMQEASPRSLPFARSPGQGPRRRTDLGHGGWSAFYFWSTSRLAQARDEGFGFRCLRVALGSFGHRHDRIAAGHSAGRRTDRR